MESLIGAKIIEYNNKIQYQSYIKVELNDGSCYLITISNSKKFVLSESIKDVSAKND